MLPVTPSVTTEYIYSLAGGVTKRLIRGVWDGAPTKIRRTPVILRPARALSQEDPAEPRLDQIRPPLPSLGDPKHEVHGGTQGAQIKLRPSGSYSFVVRCAFVLIQLFRGNWAVLGQWQTLLALGMGLLLTHATP